MRGRDQRIRW